MPVQSRCPACSQHLTLPDNAIGKKVRCPSCNIVFTAETPTTQPVAPAEAAPVEVNADSATGIKSEGTALPKKTAKDPLPPTKTKPATRKPLQKASSRSGWLMVLVGVGLLGCVGITCVGGLGGFWYFAGHREEGDIPLVGKNPLAPEQGLPEDKVGPPKMPPVVRNDLPARLPIHPPKLAEDKVTLPLPDSVTDVIIGGDGRFLFCLIPTAKQLAVFDANEAKIVKYLPLAGENAHIAAGGTKLFILFPDTKIIQRWNLATLERELSTTLTLNDKLAGIGMGYGSDGPLFVQTSRGIISGEQLFFDAKTMKRLDIKRNAHGHVHIGDRARVRASANGRVYGITAEHDSGHILVLDKASCTARSMEGRGFIPGADGKNIFGRGVHTLQGQNTLPHARWCVPALHGNFYLSFPVSDDAVVKVADKSSPMHISLHIVGDTRPLMTLPHVDSAFRDDVPEARNPLRVDQRYHLIPDAQILVRIPLSNDKLVVYKLDLDSALDKAGIDYLFVRSAPTPFAVKGEEFQYQLQVKAKKGVKKYNVDSGPAGMKVSPTGLVTWKTPKDYAEPSVDVILSIADSGNQEIFHTFRLAVLAEAPKADAK